MATLDQEGANLLPPSPATIDLPKLSIAQILSISIYYLALNFHWAALNIIVLPSQVFKIVGDANKGAALAFVLVPGAFVSLFANPLFGLLSDRTRGKLAAWGRRRPYIFFGTLINIGALIWMAFSPNLVSLAIAFILVQFSSNCAQAPFHALLPDVVPSEQRGLVSGIMGVLLLIGNIAGVIIAGMLIDANKPLALYLPGLWLTYGLIIGVLLVFMLITVIAVREPRFSPSQSAELEAAEPVGLASRRSWYRPSWLTRHMVNTIGLTVLAIAAVWLLMVLWNIFRPGGVSINDGVQQVVLEVIATFGLLSIFDFRPRRDPDFAWVLLTRLLVSMGIYTIQTFLQYYMRDAVGAAHPEQETTNFVILVSLTSLGSSLLAGWLSDRYGRKLMVYISGGFMALVGVIFMFTHSLPLVLLTGAIFGLGYGAYTSVDWALVADVLPSHRNYARDMGIWNVSSSLPQVIAPVLGGPIIDIFVERGQPILAYQILFSIAVFYCLIGTYLVRYIRGIKR